MPKRILITGSNRGLGLEFVKQFAHKGYQVIATCRQPNKAKDLRDLKGDIEVRELDITAETKLRDLKDKLLNTPVDILILNAGVLGQRDMEIGNIDIDNMIETFKTNSIYSLKVIETFFNNLLLGKDKKIIIISSKMSSISDNNSGGYYSYRGSKAALNAMIKSIAIDQEKNGMKFLMLHPGLVKTEMGGLDAHIAKDESVKDMIGIIEGQFQTGKFMDYKGNIIPW